MGPVCTNSKYKKYYQREVNLLMFGTAMANYEFAFTCKILSRWQYFSWSSGKKLILFGVIKIEYYAENLI